jgi:hypothetical protein
VLALTLVYLAFQSSFVQRKVIGLITNAVVPGHEADFAIGRVKLALFKKVVFEDVYLSDEARDTLFFCDKLEAKIDTFSIFRKRLHLTEIKIEKPRPGSSGLTVLVIILHFCCPILYRTAFKNRGL